MSRQNLYFFFFFLAVTDGHFYCSFHNIIPSKKKILNIQAASENNIPIFKKFTIVNAFQPDQCLCNHLTLIFSTTKFVLASDIYTLYFGDSFTLKTLDINFFQQNFIFRINIIKVSLYKVWSYSEIYPKLFTSFRANGTIPIYFTRHVSKECIFSSYIFIN